VAAAASLEASLKAEGLREVRISRVLPTLEDVFLALASD